LLFWLIISFSKIFFCYSCIPANLTEGSSVSAAAATRVVISGFPVQFRAEPPAVAPVADDLAALAANRFGLFIIPGDHLKSSF
jgi:hypothetical protein